MRCYSEPPCHGRKSIRACVRVAEKGGGGGSLQSGWNEDGSQSTAVGRSVGGSMLLAGGKMFVMAQWIENQLPLRKQPSSSSFDLIFLHLLERFFFVFFFFFFFRFSILFALRESKEREKKRGPPSFSLGGIQRRQTFERKGIVQWRRRDDVAWNEMEARRV